MTKGVAGTGTPAKIRVGYIIYFIGDGTVLHVIDVVRSAEEALRLVDENDGAKYHRFSMN